MNSFIIPNKESSNQRELKMIKHCIVYMYMNVYIKMLYLVILI